MHRVFKYEVPIQDEFSIELPRYAKVLHFDTQNNQPMLWCLVDSDNEKEEVWFRLYGTGHVIGDIGGLDYIGTCIMLEGALVWHLFKEAKIDES